MIRTTSEGGEGNVRVFLEFAEDLLALFGYWALIVRIRSKDNFGFREIQPVDLLVLIKDRSRLAQRNYQFSHRVDFREMPLTLTAA